MNKKRTILGILIIIWMIIIFLFSSQNGTDSDSTSDIIVNLIVKSQNTEGNENLINAENEYTDENEENKTDEDNKILKSMEEINNAEIEIERDYIRLFVRKAAHFMIYLVGGILVFNFFMTFKISKKRAILFSIISVIIYASSDELHQKFISERNSSIYDVMLDSIGAIVGILLNNLWIIFPKANDKQ